VDEIFPGRRSARRELVLVPERGVDLQERAPLVVGEVRVPTDLLGQVGALALLEDPGPDVERLGGDLEGPGDLLEDLGRRLSQAPLDLAQVRVRDAGHLGELAQREVTAASLLADVLTQLVPPALELLLHGRHGTRRSRAPCSRARARRYCRSASTDASPSR